MINLLPTAYKKTLRGLYRLRLINTALVLFFLIVIAGGVLLVPSYILSSVRERNLSDKLDDLRNSKNSEATKAISATIADINKKIFLFAIEKPRPSISDEVLAPIFTKQPEGVRLTSLSYETAEKNMTVRIGGVASTRETLELFKKNLETYSRFSKVDLPLSDLVKNKDVEFTITCTFI